MYDDKRNPDLNSGTKKLNPHSTNIDATLKLSDYLDYEFRIEQSVHGYVHCTVGPTCPVAHMGDVPVAGNDPIFYVHHANIDRLLSCWEAKYGLPSGSWSTQTFSFPDENGNMVSRPVSDFLDTKTLGYVYDNSTACTRTPLAVQVRSSVAAPVVLANVPTATATSQSKVSVDIPLTANARQVLSGISATTQPIYLVLADITAAAPPGAVLDVYLYQKENPAVRQFVGTVAWFSDFGVGHHLMSPMGKMGPLDKTEEFDITEQLTNLELANANSLSVAIEATTGLVSAADTQALEGTIADLNAMANVSIGSIEVRQGK